MLDDSVVGEKGAYSISPYVADDLAARHRGKVKHVYQHALNGFAVEMSEADAEAMAKDFRVAYVEEDGVMTADATQNNPPWGLDRIDQRNRPLSANLYLQLDRLGRSRLRHRHRDSHHPLAVWRSRLKRL